jgi:hypothetical protein
MAASGCVGKGGALYCGSRAPPGKGALLLWSSRSNDLSILTLRDVSMMKDWGMRGRRGGFDA